jgi:hypothetical protein
MSMESLQSWAEEELAGLDLGHAARESCAVAVLANLARGSGTRITDFAANSAQQQQAYGFVENAQVQPKALSEAAAQAALRRSTDSGVRCIVAVDGSSLNLSDEFGSKGFGRVGGQDSTRGLIVQTALAMSEDGVPVGLLAQEYWARPLEKSPKGRKGERRTVDEKETKHWLEAIATAEAAGIDAGLDGSLWFQLDRGYDCAAILDKMAESPNRFTVRGTYNRSLWPAEDNEEAHRYLVDALDASPVATSFELAIEATSEHSERTAMLNVQFARVNVRLADQSHRVHKKTADGKRRKGPVTWKRTLTVVRVRETGTAPAEEAPLQWMLWVNFDIETAAEALDVVTKYTYRWRIEEFHRTWKSGAMKVETTQARSGDNVERIARLSALVACRILRLVRRARSEPDAPATQEFSKPELMVLKHMDPRSPKQKPRAQRVGTLAWSVAVIADMGGYTGKSSGGPPGPLVIARGFQRLLDRAEGFAAALALMESNRDQW